MRRLRPAAQLDAAARALEQPQHLGQLGDHLGRTRDPLAAEPDHQVAPGHAPVGHVDPYPAAAPATSVGAPMRPSGTSLPTAIFFSPGCRPWYLAKSASTCCHIGVSMTPGEIALTRIPWGAIANAALWV